MHLLHLLWFSILLVTCHPSSSSSSVSCWCRSLKQAFCYSCTLLFHRVFSFLSFSVSTSAVSASCKAWLSAVSQDSTCSSNWHNLSWTHSAVFIEQNLFYSTVFLKLKFPVPLLKTDFHFSFCSILLLLSNRCIFYFHGGLRWIIKKFFFYNSFLPSEAVSYLQ